MASPLRVLGAHLRKEMWKGSVSNRTGIWSTALGLNTTPKVQGEKANFRLIPRSKCNLGSYRPTITNGKIQAKRPRINDRPTNKYQKLPLSSDHVGSAPMFMKLKALAEKMVLRMWSNYWKSVEVDISKWLGQYVITALIVNFIWFAYNLLLSIGLDVGFLDKLRGHERVRAQTEENNHALNLLAEILDRKDRRWTLLAEENEKMREESLRERQVHEKERSDLEEEVRVLKVAVRDLEEHEQGNKTKQGPEKDDRSEA